jgi:hypothetical protein
LGCDQPRRRAPRRTSDGGRRRRRAAFPVPELGFGDLRSAGFDSILGETGFWRWGFQYRALARVRFVLDRSPVGVVFPFFFLPVFPTTISYFLSLFFMFLVLQFFILLFYFIYF